MIKHDINTIPLLTSNTSSVIHPAKVYWILFQNQFIWSAIISNWKRYLISEYKRICGEYHDCVTIKICMVRSNGYEVMKVKLGCFFPQILSTPSSETICRLWIRFGGARMVWNPSMTVPNSVGPGLCTPPGQKRLSFFLGGSSLCFWTTKFGMPLCQSGIPNFVVQKHNDELLIPTFSLIGAKTLKTAKNVIFKTRFSCLGAPLPTPFPNQGQILHSTVPRLPHSDALPPLASPQRDVYIKLLLTINVLH